MLYRHLSVVLLWHAGARAAVVMWCGRYVASVVRDWIIVDRVVGSDERSALWIGLETLDFEPNTVDGKSHGATHRPSGCLVDNSVAPSGVAVLSQHMGASARSPTADTSVFTVPICRLPESGRSHRVDLTHHSAGSSSPGARRESTPRSTCDETRSSAALPAICTRMSSR